MALLWIEICAGLALKSNLVDGASPLALAIENKKNSQLGYTPAAGEDGLRDL